MLISIAEKLASELSDTAFVSRVNNTTEWNDALLLARQCG